MSLSTVEAKYITTRTCCTQILWMNQMLKNNEIEQETMNIHCDNFSAINISKNHVFHFCT